jgi:anti-sigma-K factor RskA
LWAADLLRQLDDVQAEQRSANEALVALSDPSASHHALERAPSDMTYEAWVIEGGQPMPAGLFSGGGDQTVVPLTARVPGGAVVAVTIERAGGVDRPTRQPIITSEQAA